MSRDATDRRQLAVLYDELQPQLVRILSSNLNAPDSVIDDACQTAWSSLLERRREVRPGGELSWLSTTATRAALVLLRMRRDTLIDPCDASSDPETVDGYEATEPGPDGNVYLFAELAEVRRLPVRQQRVLMLQGFGYGNEEIAAATGDSPRTVARQLSRGRQRLLRLVEVD